ncbi:MAG: hypothetical protein IJT32_04345 [Lachnospiraceae bacterium]|nr:hypothetical protein [Lachnospiraceae bacterium]
MDVTNAMQSLMQQAGGAAGANGAAGAKSASGAKGTGKTGDAKTADYGKTVGNPQLSDKAAEYYKQLKSKYGDMEFILVSKDEVANAKQNAAQYARKDKPVVLIDEDKLERMATDESYRKKYEGIISQSKSQLSQMADKMGGVPGIKGFGMQVNDDGTASFFAVAQKNNETMVKKLSEKRAAKKAQAKEAEKKAAKKAAEEKLAEKRADHGPEHAHRHHDEAPRPKHADHGLEAPRPKHADYGPEAPRPGHTDHAPGAPEHGRPGITVRAGEHDKIPHEHARKIHGAVKEYGRTHDLGKKPVKDDYEIVSASSVEELYKRLEDRNFALRSDSVMTEAETYVGGSIDFKL